MGTAAVPEDQKILRRRIAPRRKTRKGNKFPVRVLTIIVASGDQRRRRVVWGTVLHQMLQWHHMATSAGYPADTVANLEINTLLDGLFHTSTYIMTGVGLGLLWSATRPPYVQWSPMLLIGGLLVGWGTFNVVEGIVDHRPPLAPARGDPHRHR